jgi:hypothetical protein
MLRRVQNEVILLEGIALSHKHNRSEIAGGNLATESLYPDALVQFLSAVSNMMWKSAKRAFLSWVNNVSCRTKHAMQVNPQLICGSDMFTYTM